MTPDATFIREYEAAEFDAQYRRAIADALNRVDRARDRLTSAQNFLVRTLEGSNDYTRAAFEAFYAGGGVTARDWEERPASMPTRRRRGQLRVVRRR